VPIARTRAQTRNARVHFSEDEDEIPEEAPSKEAAPKVLIQPAAKEKNKVTSIEPPITVAPQSATVDIEDPEPEHPF
jgi:hypothetical protein